MKPGQRRHGAQTTHGVLTCTEQGGWGESPLMTLGAPVLPTDRGYGSRKPWLTTSLPLGIGSTHWMSRASSPCMHIHWH